MEILDVRESAVDHRGLIFAWIMNIGNEEI